MGKTVLCEVIEGITADAMRLAFDTWNVGGEATGRKSKKMIVSVVLFDATHLLVFYYSV
jgi:hypothetical protein